MKTFFFFMLIFLFLSCGGGKKTPESVVTDSDSWSDGDITEDAGIEIEPCGIRNPCKGVEHSTGECTVNENAGYVCSCEKGYAWFGEEDGCLSIKNFYGSVRDPVPERWRAFLRAGCSVCKDGKMRSEELFCKKIR